MIAKENITGIIIAGGKSTRMGRDKGFLELNGKLFMTHIIEALQPLVSEIIISSDHTDHDTFGLRRIEDTVKDAGPLAGLYSGLAASNTDYNLILSCDIPLITSKVLKKLIEKEDHESDITMFEQGGKAMPLVALYNKSCSKKLKTILDSGERRLQQALEPFNVKSIKITEQQKALSNINTKTQLNAIKSC